MAIDSILNTLIAQPADTGLSRQRVVVTGRRDNKTMIRTYNGHSTSIARFITDQQLQAFKLRHQSHSLLKDGPEQK